MNSNDLLQEWIGGVGETLGGEADLITEGEGWSSTERGGGARNGRDLRPAVGLWSWDEGLRRETRNASSGASDKDG